MYDPERQKDAHLWCQKKALEALKAGKDVVVSNTFTRRWEMDVYINFGYPVEIQVASGEWENVHGVPSDKIELMRQRWED